MPNTKSAIRRINRTEQQVSVNRIRKSKYKSIIKAINFAQECTKIVVQKHGVSVVTKEEIQNYE